MFTARAGGLRWSDVDNKGTKKRATQTCSETVSNQILAQAQVELLL